MSHLMSFDRGLRVRLLEIEPIGQEMELWCWAACSEMMGSYLRTVAERHGASQAENNRGHEDLRQGAQANARRSRRTAEAADGDGSSGEDEVDCSCAQTAAAYKACNENGWPHFFEFEEFAQSTEWSSYRFVLEELGVPLKEDGWPRRVRGRLSSWQLRDLVINGGPELQRRLFEAEDCALSWPMLQSLLDHQVPVIFGWRYPEGGGHFMVAAGYVITPPAQRWVVVLDPLPPDHGDIYLVPYEYWVTGPYGRHWRDWWVPYTGPDQPMPPRYSLDHLRVGRELVRAPGGAAKGGLAPDTGHLRMPPEAFSPGSARPAPTIPAPATTVPGRRRSWLGEEEEVAARALAEQGLEALRVMASQGPELASTLGMGGSVLRMVLKGFLLSFLESSGRAELAATVAGRFEPVSIEPEDLILGEEFIPVFRLGSSDLKEWDGADPSAVLNAPKQVIFRVERDDLTTFRFFSTITVERHDEHWRLASIGRSSLTSTLSTEELFAVLGWTGEGAEFSFAGLAQRLDELDLLESLVRLVPIAELDSLLAAESESEGDEEGESQERAHLLRRLRQMILDGSVDARALISLAEEADQIRGVVPKQFEAAIPDFAVDVGELYQLFIAFDDDKLEPVYPSSFYPPDRRVGAGEKAEVLRQLKELAQKA